MPAGVRTVSWHSKSHITGPAAVLVSIAFGETPEAGPLVTKSLSVAKTDGTVAFDLDRYVREVVEGVSKANKEFGGDLSVAQMRIVPDDYPSPGQVAYVAYKIAKYVLTGSE